MPTLTLLDGFVLHYEAETAARFRKKKIKALGLSPSALRNPWLYENRLGEVYAFARYRGESGQCIITTLAYYAPRIGWINPG